MFDDIIGKKEPLGMISCASCAHGHRKPDTSDCPKDHKKCFNDGEIMEYKGWKRFNPVYHYSEWEYHAGTTDKDRLQETI